MLRITTSINDAEFRFVLEGKLAGPWVSEFQESWRGAKAEIARRSLVVDLKQVDYVDGPGRELLRKLHEAGASFVTATPFMKDLVAGIAEARSKTASSSVSLTTIVFFLALIAQFLLMAVSAHGQTPALRLNMRQAIELALSPEGSARIEIAEENVKQAQSRSAQARAALLPDLDGTVGYSSQTRNLEAVGLQLRSPVPGFEIPAFVGPFNVFDARANVRQSIFDLSSIKRYQASKSGIQVARSERLGTSEQVAGQVARAFLTALRTDAQREAVQADVTLAKELLEQAEQLKRAGTGTGIEVTRARVQLANQEQRLLVAENENRGARLQLLKAMGMRLDTAFDLADKLAYVPVEIRDPRENAAVAFKTRPDLAAQQNREHTAQLSSRATDMERIPSIMGFADYGSIGTGVDNSLPTRTYGISVKIPIFDGGRRDARRAESKSQYRQEQARTRDLKDQIELEVRLAIDNLRSADDQVKVAKDGLDLADNELAQARRRHEAGVANGIEVTDAQTRLERARDNYIAAVYNHSLARVDLAQARGNVIEVLQ